MNRKYGIEVLFNFFMSEVQVGEVNNQRWHKILANLVPIFRHFLGEASMMPTLLLSKFYLLDAVCNVGRLILCMVSLNGAALSLKRHTTNVCYCAITRSSTVIVFYVAVWSIIAWVSGSQKAGFYQKRGFRPIIISFSVIFKIQLENVQKIHFMFGCWSIDRE